MKMSSLTVNDMDKSGLVTFNGETVRLRSMKLGGQDCEVLDIAPASNHYHFNSDAREFSCCGKSVDEDDVLIVTDKKYVVPCYDCGGWATWKKHNGHGVELSRLGWGA